MKQYKWYRIEYRIENIPNNVYRDYKASSAEEAVMLLKREFKTIEHILAVWERVL